MNTEQTVLSMATETNQSGIKAHIRPQQVIAVGHGSLLKTPVMDDYLCGHLILQQATRLKHA